MIVGHDFPPKRSDVVSLLVGPGLVADSGGWATHEWSEHVLGAPGYRIAGGSDEIQRNIIGDRVLGLVVAERREIEPCPCFDGEFRLHAPRAQ